MTQLFFDYTRSMRQGWVILFLVFFLPFNTTGTPKEDQVKADAASLVQTFGKNLTKSLTNVITKGGVPGAIGFCGSAAPELTDEHAQPGLVLGRTSHRVRNPKNAPKEWMKPLLQEFQGSSNLEPKEAQLISLDDKRWGYASPIYATSLCLKCHGTEMKPDVKEAILARYPEDQATGFKRGDFRGLFWVEISKE